MQQRSKDVIIILNGQKIDTLVEHLLKSKLNPKQAIHKYVGNIECITDETTTLLFPKIHQEFAGYSHIIKAYIKISTLGAYLQKDPSLLTRLSLKTDCVTFY